MTHFSTHRSIGPFSWRGKPLGIGEINSILNILDNAALIIDVGKGVVLSANNKFYSLTAFTQTEVIGAAHLSLLSESPSNDPFEEKESLATLQRHKRDPLKVIQQRVFLDSTHLWELLLLIPYDLHLQLLEKTRWQKNLLASFSNLSNLSLQPDLYQTYTYALECSRSLLNASLIAIYSGETERPLLQKIVTTETENNMIFPETITSSELIRLQSPNLWQPGKKVSSELQRVARIANLQYLATLPLGQPGAWVGLLVVADPQFEPFDEFMTLLDILGINLGAAIQNQIFIKNTTDKIENNRQALAIHTSISENSKEGIIILDNKLAIKKMNPSAELILGYASQEVIGQQIENILIGTESLTSALRSAIQGIPTQNLGNLRLHKRNGQAFPAHLQTIPVMQRNQESASLHSIIIFINDLSENEQIRVQTQQLEQRAILGEVTAIFAHEVRNPINNISTGLQLMTMNLAENDPNREVISRLENDCTRLTTLMDSVLSFSRPMEYKTEPIDLGVLLPRILDRWRPRLTGANVQPYFQSNLEEPIIAGDPRALEQVFTNLISNAVHAMKEGGTLAIKISKGKPNQDPPQIEITVSDSGPGIPDEIRDHIFKPFVTTSPEGTGLGLAITKRIITAHRGGISVNSFPGGTVFTISLPEIIKEVK
jgi:two-component system, NtrC family, sensor histidine kinase AtoS